MQDEKSRPRRGARLLLVGGSLLLPVAMLALLEGGLRVLGLGAPTASKLAYQRIDLPILQPGELPDGTPDLRTADPRLPYQSIRARKPENALRVFTFGGSATAGLGFSPNVTFARHLERMLIGAYPEREVELTNLGIVALSSDQVKRIVADVCERYAPDLLIVYSGNNEFLEIHAEKYARAHSSGLSRTKELLVETHAVRLLGRLVHGEPGPPSAEERRAVDAGMRLTQRTIVKDIEMTPDEIAKIVDRYEANIDELAVTAQDAGIPLLLLSVGANWEWRGREDLPEGWLDELAGAGTEAEQLPRALESLDAALADVGHPERHERLFERAVVHERLGNAGAARADYRAAMNADPHLRRALDVMNDRVREVAERRGVGFLDTVALLSERAPDGIVGFDEYYDYVHFTPRGVVLVAAGIFDALHELALLPPSPQLASDAYVSERLAALEHLSEDSLDVFEWMGFCGDPGLVPDRDLWKYDRMMRALEDRLLEDPNDVKALVYRGNAKFFRVDGAEQAERDYRAALALEDLPEASSNLERLLSERTP